MSGYIADLTEAKIVAAELRQELNAARSLLREVLEAAEKFRNSIECDVEFDGASWERKTRSYLDACDTLEGKC